MAVILLYRLFNWYVSSMSVGQWDTCGSKGDTDSMCVSLTLTEPTAFIERRSPYRSTFSASSSPACTHVRPFQLCNYSSITVPPTVFGTVVLTQTASAHQP